MKLFTIFILASISSVQAETKGLRIMGRVSLQARTSMTETRRGTNHVQWAITHSSNARNREAEKIEIEGEVQSGLTTKMNFASDNGKFIQHKILLDLVSYNNSEKKPVILKISAN